MVKTTLDTVLEEPDYYTNQHQHVLHHTFHCIDWLRQALVCNADLSLDATANYRSYGQDSEHKCRDFGEIWDWANNLSYQGSIFDLGNDTAM